MFAHTSTLSATVQMVTLAASLLTIAAIVLGAVRSIKRGYETSIATHTQAQTAEIVERVERVEKELHPNGGSSARDSMNRMEAEQARQGAVLDDLSVRVVRLEREAA